MILSLPADRGGRPVADGAGAGEDQCHRRDEQQRGGREQCHVDPVGDAGRGAGPAPGAVAPTGVVTTATVAATPSEEPM